MTTCKVIPLVVLSLTICVLVGCGESGPDLFAASGTVTMDGAAVEGATVTFVPSGKAVGQVAGAGQSDASGKFTIIATSGRDGITAGEYKVKVRKVEGEGFDGGPGASKEQQDKAMMDMMTGKQKPLKYIVPAKYSDVTKTPLIVTVTNDSAQNEFVLDIKP